MTTVSALRQFVRPRDAGERCDFCGVSLPGTHVHQFHPAVRRIRCACNRCAGLAGEWREIPRGVRMLNNFLISDSQWDDMMIPISLAFFSYSTPANRTVAFYPGPAGAAESMMRLETWRDIASANPELLTMQPDVEALLVNRVGGSREYFLVPIDECYKLVGLIRIHWHGLSGGARVWGEITQFFDGLRKKDMGKQAGASCTV